MSREIYLALMVIVLLIGAFFVYNTYSQYSEVQALRDVVEVEADVLRVNQRHPLEEQMNPGGPGSTHAPPCTADLRFELDGATHQAQVPLTDGECRNADDRLRMQVLVLPSDPSRPLRTFDGDVRAARRGEIPGHVLFNGLLALAALIAALVLLWKAIRFKPGVD